MEDLSHKMTKGKKILAETNYAAASFLIINKKASHKEMQEWFGIKQNEYMPQFLQKTTNQICCHFGLEPIPVLFFWEGGNIRGEYCCPPNEPRFIKYYPTIYLNMATEKLEPRKIMLWKVVSTLLHELAHYLHTYYQCFEINGCSRTNKPHGIEFFRCLEEVTGFCSRELKDPI